MERNVDKSYKSLCCTCLSIDRKLTSIHSFTEIYQVFRLIMYDEGDKYGDSKIELNQLVCWECLALMKRFWKFKRQVHNAQEHLQVLAISQAQKTIDYKYMSQSLSSLESVIKPDYDRVFVDHAYETKTNEWGEHYITISAMNSVKIEPQALSDNISSDIDYQDTELENTVTGGMLSTDTLVAGAESYTAQAVKGEMPELIIDPTAGGDTVIITQKPKILTIMQQNETKPNMKSGYTTENMTETEMLLTREEEKKKVHYVSQEYKCELCIIGFYTQQQVEDHFVTMHREKPGYVPCRICYVYTPELKVKEHTDSHYLRHICKVCNKVEYSVKLITDHIQTHLSKRKPSTLIQIGHDTAPSKSRKTRTDKDKLQEDEKPKPSNLLLAKTTVDEFKCVECDIFFATSRARTTHAVRVHKEGLQCDHCKKLFADRGTITKHLRRACTKTVADQSTIAAPKTKAQKQREYRQRLAASRTRAQAIVARKLDAERQRNCRLRKAASSAIVSGSLESTTASSSRFSARSKDVQTRRRQTLAAEPAQITVQPGTSSEKIEVQQAQSTWNTKWSSSIMRFKSTFLDNDFGYACSVCDRLWFKNDLKPITAAQLEVISEWFIKENRRLCREEYEMVCNNCKRSLNKKLMPLLAKVNGFSYPIHPPSLPQLDLISERLITPRLPFMQVRRLRHDLSYGIIGQVINVPVDVKMVKRLPRQLNEDDVINVNIKRNLAHKTEYFSEYVSKSTIGAWLTVLQKSPLYRLYKINVDFSRLHSTVPVGDDMQDDPSNRMESISAENTSEPEILASRQHTMMWNEEDCFNIAHEHQATIRNTIDDRHAEELSFPSIYFGEPRQYNKGVSVTPSMIATSEIRRRDRRGATPQKILYVAMKLLRLRMVSIYSTVRNVSVTENVTRRMLEDAEFQKEYVTQNLAFMKTVPNSDQYWASRKRDLLAMIRHLGKPTVFLTISANEIRWMKLLTILLKLSKKYPGKSAKDLNTFERCTLVSDDPVTCCIYFYRLVGSLMKMLKSKQSYSPFGKYYVIDYFLRIEFQHQGSPRAHILLWLNDDPCEVVSENMPRTIDMIEKLCSVSRADVPNNSIYANQIHRHTFTCTKPGETTCRFGIPHWPMPTTRVLVPIPQSDECRQTLQKKAKELRTSLVERRYSCMDEFLNANGLTYVSYLYVVRSTLRRPTLFFRRNFDELMTNTFNPYLAGEVDSNIDIQFILDEYSCAEYVVEYVNKSARGMGDLRRELTTMIHEHPAQDCTGQLQALSIKLLNAVEMSAQEAAWYLLRQPMSETSRPIVYIPTVWPTERPRCRKRRQQLDREGIDGDSTDVWTKNIIQRYEERPESLEQVYLAEFASWYANANDFVDDEDDVNVDDDEDFEPVPEARTSRASKEYRRRQFGRVIRYRRYDIDETVDYKREMVLLYVQFRNEISEIVEHNKFLQLFDDNKDTIMERHSLFETNLNIENVTKELEATTILPNDDNSNLQEEEDSRAAFVQRSIEEHDAECDDKTEVLRACKNYLPSTTGDHS